MSNTSAECEPSLAGRRRVNLAWKMLGQPRSAYSIHELAIIGPVSRPILYREIADGKLVARKIRGRTVVLAADWENYLRDLPRMESGSEPPALRQARQSRKAATAAIA